VSVGYAPPGGQLLEEGVLGEMLIRALLGEGPRAPAAAAGWGGDWFRAWDVSGRTVLVWRSGWDSAAGMNEFLDEMRDHLMRAHNTAHTSHGWITFSQGGWSRGLTQRDGSVYLVASDDAHAVEAAEHALR